MTATGQYAFASHSHSVFVSLRSGSRRPPRWRFPKAPATEGLRSFRTSSSRSQCPNLHNRFTGWTPAPFSALRSRKVSQFYNTPLAINTAVVLGAVPKTTAAFANFQLHAQLHDSLSQGIPGCFD